MFVIIAGVSGAGKDTIKKELIKRINDVVSLPSYTSRKPRGDEEEGVQYHFISKEEFEQKIKDGELYEYDEHHGQYYGTSKKILNEKIESGKIIVKDIDVVGTENLLKLISDKTKIVTIFLRVTKDELRRRLINRGDNLTEEQINIRLNRFDYEESKINIFDYIIKNDDLEKTIKIITTIIETERNDDK